MEPAEALLTGVSVMLPLLVWTELVWLYATNPQIPQSTQ